MLRTVSWLEIRSWEITLTCLKGWAILEIPRLWQTTASSQCSTHHVEYWSPYAKESRPNLTPFGRYKYLRPPSGINLAPEEFESKLHNKLDGLPGVEVISDDILVMGYGENDEKANQNHKNLLRLLDRSHPVLKYYDLEEEDTVQRDASKYGLGAALLQNCQPVAFASRSLSRTERQYVQNEKNV